MGSDDHIRTIQNIYEAFGRGDVAAIVDALADDVDWATEAASDAAPWYGGQHGKEEVPAFFEAFGSTMEVAEFAPQAFAANESDVFAVVRCRGSVRSTGKPFDMNLHHWFRFRDSKIYYYRGSEDTAQVESAIRG